MLKAAGTWNAAYDTWSGKHGVTTSWADGLVHVGRADGIGSQCLGELEALAGQEPVRLRPLAPGSALAAQRRRRIRDLERRAGRGHQLVLGRRDLTERGTRGTASR
jgi:hypothetical protein